ncbi:hypothetical protein [Altericroceibacterium spongiae]|nr:hypothetical protein [Altericroceibacterium spongiae]
MPKFTLNGLALVSAALLTFAGFQQVLTVPQAHAATLVSTPFLA